MTSSLWLWLGFNVFVLAMLALDLGAFHRKSHIVSFREAIAWIIYVFGAFLILTGIKMIVKREEEIHPERNPVVKWFKKLMPVTSDYREDKFFVRENGVRMATPVVGRVHPPQ